MCCEPIGLSHRELERIRSHEPERVAYCPDCETETVDGEATEGCGYSPEVCKTCGWKPCDQSCQLTYRKTVRYV